MFTVRADYVFILQSYSVNSTLEIELGFASLVLKLSSSRWNSSRVSSLKMVEKTFRKG